MFIKYFYTAIFLIELYVWPVVTCLETGWFKQLSSENGWSIGDGYTVRIINKTQPEGLCVIDVSNMDLGVRFHPVVNNTELLEVELYSKDVTNEGRNKKGSGSLSNNNVIPMVITYKMAILLALSIAAAKLISIKALVVAKLALVAFAILSWSKFNSKPQYKIEELPYIEFEHDDPFTYQEFELSQASPYAGKDSYSVIPSAPEYSTINKNDIEVAHKEQQMQDSYPVSKHDRVGSDGGLRKRGKYRPRKTLMKIREIVREEGRDNKELE